VGEAAEHTVASGAEGLLVTKLQVPRLPPVFVARSRLVDQLNAGLGERSRSSAPLPASGRHRCSRTGASIVRCVLDG
jgi:hypothetical protein